MDPFVESHRARWERLSELLKTVDRSGLRGLDAAELEEFGRLYRQVTTHLAQARAEHRDPRIIEHLNLLAGRAHAVIYRRRRRRSLRPWRFLATEFPQVFRRTFRFTVTSAALFIGSAALAYALAVNDPGWLDHTAPKGLPEAIEPFIKGGDPAGAYFARVHTALGGGALSALLWTHNLQIGLAAFALGIGCCVGTVWALTANGMMVGSVLAIGAIHNEPALVWAIMAPHGVIELSAIMISGGAGLRLGWAVISPGDLTRRDAVVLAAREAMKLMLGVAPMFVVAGLIEGTISPIASGVFARDDARILFGAATGVILVGYLAVGDRLLGRLSLRRGRGGVGRPTTREASPSAPDSD